ncbi:Uncharacterized protein TCAP_07211 [Tolypocladium capitatum]|uniref:Cytochrome b5 heme-binding domain-containing protein n=1 Tax=Tolypocladium capitatum TaxID=45235 RepID=A0A2K3Q2W5_9HYPO|nr:Uncharacterized protein TCAP_07211 [Tolypocladium capitatum]
MAQTLQVVTLAQLAQHNTKDDLWVAVHGKVYHLSSFATDHPGGIEVLLECAGTNGTETYDYAGHSEGAKDTLERFLVGELEGHVGSQAEPGPEGAKSTSMSPTPAPKVKEITKPWVRLLLLSVTGVFGFTGLRRLLEGELHVGPLNAFWAGVFLASLVGCIALGYVYDQFSKTLQHAEDPFSYPAVIPRIARVIR